MELIDPKLKNDFIEVIRYSQDIEEPKVEKLLRNWYTAKAPIMTRFFKDKTMIRLPEKTTFVLNDEAKAERLQTFIEYVANLLEQLGGWDHKLVRYLDNLTVQEFYNNSLKEDYRFFDTKVQKGTKVVKSFKYFIDDEKLLHDIQNKASEIIQENKVEGYLTFSVHPLDFLSSSENCFNWRSCHSLDGEYRTGNLSYMCDESTIVCYLQSEDEVKLPHFPETVPWNNKKWRVLLHFNTTLNVVFAGRQYPFSSPGALETIRQAMIDKMLYTHRYATLFETKWSHWHNDYIDCYAYENFTEEDNDVSEIVGEEYAVINHRIWGLHNIVHDAENSKHYNDLLNSSTYTKPYYMFEKRWMPNDLNFLIGKEILCLHCGEAPIDGYDSMMCPDCECKYGNSKSEEYRSCDCCGTRFYDTYWHYIGNEYVCEHCFETECFECEDCGKVYFNSDKYWDEKSKQFLCESCYEERKDEN